MSITIAHKAITKFLLQIQNLFLRVILGQDIKLGMFLFSMWLG
jgi:hypothetical protein